MRKAVIDTMKGGFSPHEKPPFTLRYIINCFFVSFFTPYMNFNRRLLSTTLTLEKAIRAEAHMGVIWKSMPKM